MCGADTPYNHTGGFELWTTTLRQAQRRTIEAEYDEKRPQIRAQIYTQIF